MAQPQAYNREIDFTERDGDDTNHTGINTELDAAALSINQLRANIALIQKDDGSLQNGIVTAESLAPSAFDAVAEQLAEATQDAQDAANAATLAASTALGARDTSVASASAASTSASNAAAAAANAATAAQTLFNGLWLGAQASDPATDLNGQPLTTGDFYYNTTSKLFKVYDASILGFASAAPSGQFKRPKFTAGVDFTAGVTTSLTLATDPVTLMNTFVFFDGVVQHSDQYALSGTTLTFTSPIPTGVTSVEVAYLETIGQYTLFDESVTDEKIAPDAGIQATKLAFTQAGTGAVQRTLQDKEREYVSVLDYGADPTGATNSVRAFNFAMRSGKSVYIPRGTYLIEADTTPGTPFGDFMIYIGNNGSDPFLQSNLNGLTVFGDGYQSVIKLGDNVGRNRLLFGAGAGDALANMTFRDFAIDFNGANNLQTSYGDPLRYNSGFYFFCPCYNMTFENLYWYNFSGSQGLRIGNDTSGGYGANIRVLNCRINNFGIGLSGNFQQDVSVFYIQADGILIDGCWFQNSDFMFDLSRGQTALELHGDSSTIVTNNRFSYTQSPILIVSSAKAHENVLIDGNVFEECNYMVGLDPAEYNQKRITISNNVYNSTKVASSSIVTTGMSGETTKTRENVVFSGNTVTAWGSTVQGTHLFYVDNMCLRSLLIEGNDISGLNGHLIYFAGTVRDSDYAEVTIKNNRLDSLGPTSGSYPNSPAFVHFNITSGNVNAVVIDGNVLFNSSGKNYSAFGAIRLAGSIKYTWVDGNETMVSSAYPHVVDGVTSPTFKRIEQIAQTGQVKFPATQNASTDVNTLDDYEEGTWTPTLTTDGVNFTSVTYTIQQGKYTKVGNVVHYWATVYTSAVTKGAATGSVRIGGLPFAASSTTERASVTVGVSVLWGADNPSGGEVVDALTVINLNKRTTANGQSADVVVADVGTGANNFVRVSGSYMV
jgi:hypothetical protein